MHRFLCYGSYGLPILTLLVGVIAHSEEKLAWARRETWVTWFDGPGSLGLYRAKLFPPDAQPLRRRAVRWQLAAHASAAATLVIIFVLSRHPAFCACLEH